ncbi:transcription termination factor 2 [Euwallacea fornicatus]|uniref:transcription termination factor 2 n=1 Tax=Euwallacea fornicatus TaxID=995702 RepID=UPI00338E79D9
MSLNVSSFESSDSNSASIEDESASIINGTESERESDFEDDNGIASQNSSASLVNIKSQDSDFVPSVKKKVLRIIDSDDSNSDDESQPIAKPRKSESDTVNYDYDQVTSFRLSTEGIINSTVIQPHPRGQAYWRQNEDSSSVEEVPDESRNAIVEISSDEECIIPISTPLKPSGKSKNAIRQPTLHELVAAQPNDVTVQKNPTLSPQCKSSENLGHVQTVNQREYGGQQARVENALRDFEKLKRLAEGLDLEMLPDKGELITKRLSAMKSKFVTEQKKLENMIVADDVEEVEPNAQSGAFHKVNWEDIQSGANAVLPKTFGKKALSTYNTQKTVTMDRLQQLHGALQACPKEEDMADDPKGLKVELMPHQKRALAWLMFREKAKPSGGILADDMGLGKTLTMIALIVKEIQLKGADSNEENLEKDKEWLRKEKKVKGGSLIVCPASLLNQWSGEIDKRLKRGLVSYNLYHGAKRETRTRELAQFDVVITTYSIVSNESEKKSPLFSMYWRRIILDEAHQIRNYKTQSSEACCRLSAKSRWALTGTPMHNKELDMYAQLKFLRCTPFDELQVWKRWIGDKSSGGQERLHTVISSLMLRRTKAELIEKNVLISMPEKKWLLIEVHLEKNELQVYHKVLIFSQTLFAQFLHQRAEKNQDYVDQKFIGMPAAGPNQEYNKMRQKLLRLNKVKNVSQHEILVLLLRLRQICCHPSLITAMLEEGLETVHDDEDDEGREELNLLEQIQKLDINDTPNKDEDEYNANSNSTVDNNAAVNLKEAARGHLKLSDPVFAKERASSKIKYMLKVLGENVLSKGDKAVIVSQWSSYLNLIGMHLKETGIDFYQLDGKVPVHKRMDIINKINDPGHPTKILLLSLTAGGVGLNLVGANHLFLLDLHWNPQLERQAQDRIYRVGQTKPVFMYKFMAVDTIEERIKLLQDKKLSMAEAILTGTKQVGQNKLSIDDLKMIFGLGPNMLPSTT